MTADVRPIAPALDWVARRRRARRFWGAMGAMKRFEDRRLEPTRIRIDVPTIDAGAKRAA